MEVSLLLFRLDCKLGGNPGLVMSSREWRNLQTDQQDRRVAQVAQGHSNKVIAIRLDIAVRSAPELARIKMRLDEGILP